MLYVISLRFYCHVRCANILGTIDTHLNIAPGQIVSRFVRQQNDSKIPAKHPFETKSRTHTHIHARAIARNLITKFHKIICRISIRWGTSNACAHTGGNRRRFHRRGHITRPSTFHLWRTAFAPYHHTERACARARTPANTQHTGRNQIMATTPTKRLQRLVSCVRLCVCAQQNASRAYLSSNPPISGLRAFARYCDALYDDMRRAARMIAGADRTIIFIHCNNNTTRVCM